MPMRNTKFTQGEIREMINKGELSDPLFFFDSVMNGQDPRKQSEIYRLIMEIEDFNSGEAPCKEDWEEVVDFVLTHFKYERVSLKDSQLAAKELAAYTHPKQKTTELSINEGGGKVDGNPLTSEEAETFLEKFDDEF